MTAPETVLQDKDTTIQSELYMSFELGDKQWKLTLGDGRRGPSRHTVTAGNKGGVQECIGKAKLRCKLPPRAKVHSCYEAGRDGWWLHRWLVEQGVDNIVVDSASIEVNRRARRAKSDRLDGDKLLEMLLRWHRGERRVWSVLREPSPEEEDARRTHRELERLMKERIGHTNRISSLLVLHNLRPKRIGGRDWSAWWASHYEQIPPALRIEVEREQARLTLVKQQMSTLQAAQRQEVAEGRQPVVSRLSQLRAIGPKSAWVLAKEVFGWRRFANRRELAGCLGLAPTPYASGDILIEQSISKAGNKRARTLLVELSWRWLTLQPDSSSLTQWFNTRFAGSGKRSRRIGIVALARRLAIALWRYLEHGEIPAGAMLKPATA
jgi:transposase